MRCAPDSLNNLSKAALNTLSVIVFTGEDAQHFLHQQLTQSTSDWADNSYRVTGYCTPKGRLLATGLLYKSLVRGTYSWIVRTDVVDMLIKRLRMYVLRSKVTIRHATERKLFAVIGDQSESHAERSLMSGSTDITDQCEALMLPCASASLLQTLGMDVLTSRSLHIYIDNPDLPDSATSDFTIKPVLPEEEQVRNQIVEVWTAHEMLTGMAWIGHALADKLIPQTVNLDQQNGISFTKGCYPGQEIVARTHYLGKTKHRMLLATAAINSAAKSSLTPNQADDLYEVQITENSDVPQALPISSSAIGRIINIGRLPDRLLIQLETTDAFWQTKILQTADGTVLSCLPLQVDPFSILKG